MKRYLRLAVKIALSARVTALTYKDTRSFDLSGYVDHDGSIGFDGLDGSGWFMPADHMTYLTRKDAVLDRLLLVYRKPYRFLDKFAHTAMGIAAVKDGVKKAQLLGLI